MKREALALGMLLFLFLISLWSIDRAEKLIDSVTEKTQLSLELALCDDLPGAEEALYQAMEIWRDAEGYTHIFIRHSELDRCTDSFFEIKTMLFSAEKEELKAGFELLHSQLGSIAAMEWIRPGNIF